MHALSTAVQAVPQVSAPRTADRAPIAVYRSEYVAGLVRSLGDLLTRLGRTAPGKAARYLLRVIADKSQTRSVSGASLLVEVSVGYVAEGVEVSVGSARAGFDAVRRLVREVVLPPHVAEELGWPLRPLGKGRKRGPLRVYPVEVVAAAREVIDLLDEAGEPTRATGRAWRTFERESLAALGYRPISDGRKVVCPLHDDTDPSLVVFGGEVGRCGAAYCHGGCGSIFWTRAADGSRWCRASSLVAGEGDRTSSADVIGGEVAHGPATGSFLVINPALRRSNAPERAVPRSVVGGVRPGIEIAGDAVRRLLGEDCGYVAADRSTRGLRRRWTRDPIAALAWSDRAGPVAERAAQQAACLAAAGHVDPSGVLPDRYLSVGTLRADRIDLRPVRRADDLDDEATARALAVPVAWSPGPQRWVLVDLDDLDRAPGWRGAGCVAAVAEVVRGEAWASSRVAVVQTSPTGVQIWVERADEITDPATWWRDRNVRREYLAFGARILDAVRSSGRTGGRVDPTAAAAGRYGRRTGWRLVEGLWPFRVRLLGAVAEVGGPVLDAGDVRRVLRGD